GDSWVGWAWWRVGGWGVVQLPDGMPGAENVHTAWRMGWPSGLPGSMWGTGTSPRWPWPARLGRASRTGSRTWSWTATGPARRPTRTGLPPAPARGAGRQPPWAPAPT